MKECIKIHPQDNVMVALRPLKKGESVWNEQGEIQLKEDIPQGHKFAIRAMQKGELVVKYGAPIGSTIKEIALGEWVHVHNIRTNLDQELDYIYKHKKSSLSREIPRSFRGYRRKSGSVGVRNELWIIPTVGCVNEIAQMLAQKNGGLAQGGIDAIVAFTHPYGCSQMGEDQENTRRILADLINHPNAGGVLVLGLGCENSNISVLKDYIGQYDPARVKFLECQLVENEVEDGTKLLQELARFLYQRWKTGLPGFTILACELIDHNGEELRKIVLRHIREWGLEPEFKAWVEEKNTFCSSLVDRIVPGYPKKDADKLTNENEYEDKLMDTGEVFGFWVIEGPQRIAERLGIQKAKLEEHIIVVPDHTPYKQRKVRILNGAHTSFVPGAYLSGYDIVRDCMGDDVIRGFMNACIYQEIIPTLALPKEELMIFASSVVDRFRNPFIDHRLLDICLNCTSKWKARVFPSLKRYVEIYGTLPECLTASFALYAAFYKGTELTPEGMLAARGNGETYLVKDDRSVLEFYVAHKDDDAQQYVEAVCGNEEFWGEDLRKIPGFQQAVLHDLQVIWSQGAYEGMKQAVEKAKAVGAEH